jgi:hypothetical protein
LHCTNSDRGQASLTGSEAHETLGVFDTPWQSPNELAQERALCQMPRNALVIAIVAPQPSTWSKIVYGAGFTLRPNRAGKAIPSEAILL